MRKLLVATAALFLCTPAFGSNWVLVGTSPQGQKSFLDADSVRKATSFITAWRKTEYAAPDKFGDTQEVALEYIDCGERSIAIKSWTTYGPSGDVTASGTIPEYELEWNPVIPDSIGEASVQAVCHK